MRKLAIAAVLTVLASPAMADVCTNHGFTPGTMEYLECWRYVNQQSERENNEGLRWGQAAQGWSNSTHQPMSYNAFNNSCYNQWGQHVVCRP